MRLLKHWRLIAMGCALAAGIGGGILYLTRGMSSTDMLACLPPGEGPTLYVNVGLLRKTGVLEQLAGKPGGEDADYRQFVAASGFDFRRDLDAALVQWRNGTALLVLQGRFDQERLEMYARSNGGLCARSFCSLTGSAPERKISFQPLGRGVMALAAGTDPMGAAAIRRGASRPELVPTSGPVWVSLPASSFRAQPDLPLWLNLFFQALQGARRATLTLELHADGFEVALDAPCDSAAQANTIAGRLTIATATLKSLTADSHEGANAPSAVTALSGGTFHAEQSAVRGSWPLNRAFFEGLSK